MRELSAEEKQLLLLQRTFPTFNRFLIVMMKVLGFSTTKLQLDIGAFLEFGPKDLMIQAQRGQAKSTITALFAIWYLIHHPKGSVLIISAGGKQANEISTLIVKLIMNTDILDCMRPNVNKNDRQSVEAFDINYNLRGPQKSPSIACTGVTGNLQGKRATLLIADDVESYKLARTATMREQLMQNCRDFASIVQDAAGRIVYLGTPQTDSSIYNQLPQMGFAVRIWPGRYPTPEQMDNYGSNLAPLIRGELDLDPDLQTGGGFDGSQGQPTDAQLMPEESLQAKEMKQGPAFFQLQHMLSTKLSDALRYPLKPVNLIVMRLGDLLPLNVVRGMSHDHVRDYVVGSLKVQLTTPQYVSQDVAKPTQRHMRLDPAGGGKNGDETGYAVSEHLNGNVFLRAVGGVPGGFDDKDLKELAQIIKKWNPDVLDIEKNFGFGAFRKILEPYLKTVGWEGGINETFEGTNKEGRIIDTLEPIMGRGSLVIDESIILNDWESTQRHPMDKRQTYCFFQQMAKITRDPKCLIHDDRLDSVGGTVGYWIKQLNQDSTKKEAEARAADLAAKMADPFNYKRYDRKPSRTSRSVIRRR
ncbi:terminase large subunit [Pseudomonas phage VSW-3]|uniref:DNA packaging protein n=1 Tax=Pseudomonas phage VSW-3 TaxID=1852562 RepID=A0A173GCQ7_9CAUD|nr:terminase large subunit [Pseudomonas phage VSW-3]ANH51106.1 DNA packaging protein [Pseudomonas phage VSW-3]